jgi:hypothetical protein
VVSETLTELLEIVLIQSIYPEAIATYEFMALPVVRETTGVTQSGILTFGEVKSRYNESRRIT